MRWLEGNLSWMRASGRRVAVVAANTLLTAVRHRVVALGAVVGLGLVLVARRVGEFNFGASELRFLGDFGLGAVAVTGMLLTPVLIAQLFFDDLGHGVMACLFSGRLRREEYLAGRWCGVAVMLGAFVALGTATLAIVLVVRAGQVSVGTVALGVLLQAAALIWLKLVLFAATALLVCSYSSSALFASGVCVVFAMAAHLRLFAGTGGWLRFLPAMDLFDAGALWHRQSPLEASRFLAAAAYAAAYSFCVGGLAAYVLRRREF